MNKQEFLARLQASLAALSAEEQAERMAFYSEMIDDRVEEGVSEEEAVAAIGVVELPVVQTVVTAGAEPKRQVWKTVLLWVGSPIWLSLAAAALAVVVSLWASAIALAVGSVGGAVVGVIQSLNGRLPAGLFLLGCACTGTALAIFATVGCIAATKCLRYGGKKIYGAVQRRKAEAK